MASNKPGQLEIAFRQWGGKRRGAGRPQVHRRCTEAHRERESFAPTSPVHLTLRVVDGIGTLRCVSAYRAVYAGLRAVQDRTDFAIVHASVQRDHLHLLAEAADKSALAAGTKAFQISTAHHVKQYLRRESGIRHVGKLFLDRYHPEVITSPTQAHHALAYVLLNWRKHDEDGRATTQHWLLDPYSTALSFTGWIEQPERWELPASYLPLPVSEPRTWLLREGWKKVGPISMFARPGKGRTAKR